MADTEALVAALADCTAKQDFPAALDVIRKNLDEFKKLLKPVGVKDALKKATSDRLFLAFLDGAEFGRIPLDESMRLLEKLLSFSANIPGPAGVKVLNDTWGLGTIKKIDDFYKRITVDFRTRKGHQFTFAAACDMLKVAPKDHILVFRETDPAGFESLLKDKPGEFVKRVISSNGSHMTLVKLEDYCAQNGFVKKENWKKFWDAARLELKTDKKVSVPVRKTEPIEILMAEQSYNDAWLTRFGRETDPKTILASVREFVSQNKFEDLDTESKAIFEERLSFAVKGARNVDDALYARLASQVSAMKFTNPSAEEMRGYLMERKRFIRAAALLPAREVGSMIRFLAEDTTIKAKIFNAIPELCFTAVSEIVAQFGSEPECRAVIGDLMKQPKAPATLTTLLVGKYENFKDWQELPRLITLLTHAIALGEGRQGGEVLKMQNTIRRLFGNKKWLEDVFKELDAVPSEKVLFFERFQASIAWDPSTHHTTVIRMTKIEPMLESHVVKVEKKKEYARVTSFRSFGLKKKEYLKLINEDMPKNVHDIEVARGYGDLRENFEYQAAKDEQRALMQKQTIMQAELEAVKPTDFAEATIDEVMPGVTVVCATPNGEKIWHILGEWDNDLELGVLSSKTRLASNMLGKKPGDSFELTDEDGNLQFATLTEIRPLSAEIREWMKLPEGVLI